MPFSATVYLKNQAEKTCLNVASYRRQKKKKNPLTKSKNTVLHHKCKFRIEVTRLNSPLHQCARSLPRKRKQNQNNAAVASLRLTGRDGRGLEKYQPIRVPHDQWA